MHRDPMGLETPNIGYRDPVVLGTPMPWDPSGLGTPNIGYQDPPGLGTPNLGYQDPMAPPPPRSTPQGWGHRWGPINIRDRDPLVLGPAGAGCWDQLAPSTHYIGYGGSVV